MPRIHFLNVKDGDCSVIQHYSGRVTVIDVCNAESIAVAKSDTSSRMSRQFTHAVRGNFGQKDHPVNPIEYLSQHKISGIFRFILTHPDMDHMDGIKALFQAHGPCQLLGHGQQQGNGQF